MPKHDKFSPKGIANRIKSKGLQKLRWYCQMCQKQCRDQNGFKCHLMSEGHQRQLLLFAEDTNSYMREFSKEFEKNFMYILSRGHGTKRILANEVYREYIKERNHVHMNSTIWHTLTGFVQYLGRSNQCKIDYTPKGWFIQYIDKEEEMRKEKQAQKAKHDRDDEEKMLEFIQRQVDRAKETEDDSVNEPGPTEMIKNNEQKIEFALSVPRKPNTKDISINSHLPSTSGMISAFKNGKMFSENRLEQEIAPLNKNAKIDTDAIKRTKSREERKKKSALDDIREMEELKKEKQNRMDHWLHENIIVKVVTKKLGENYYKKKGIVISLVDDYTANVRILDEKGDVLKLDQSYLETVIPALGRFVLIVNGAYRGLRAILQSIDEVRFCCQVEVDQGAAKGRLLPKVAYEDISKLAV